MVRMVFTALDEISFMIFLRPSGQSRAVRTGDTRPATTFRELSDTPRVASGGTDGQREKILHMKSRRIPHADWTSRAGLGPPAAIRSGLHAFLYEKGAGDCRASATEGWTQETRWQGSARAGDLDDGRRGSGADQVYLSRHPSLPAPPIASMARARPQTAHGMSTRTAGLMRAIGKLQRARQRAPHASRVSRIAVCTVSR